MFNFILGTITGIYMAQNFDIPDIKKVGLEILEQLKNLEKEKDEKSKKSK